MHSEAVIRSLRAHDATDLITKDALCKQLDLTAQRWYRLCRRKGFPRRYQLGHAHCVQAGAMASFLDLENAIEAGLSLSDVATYLHMTHHSVLSLYEAGELPTTIGQLRGRPRWSRESIDAWQTARLDGGRPPPGIFDSTSRRT